MGNTGSEQKESDTKKDGIPKSSPSPTAVNGAQAEQKPPEVTNGKQTEQKCEEVDTPASQDLAGTASTENGGLTLTRLTRAPPQPLDSSEESSSEEDDDKVGTWISRAVELGPDGLPSVGSAGHSVGECKRCCFFPKGRCSNGHDCSFCHFDHEKRKRLKKKKRRSENPTPTNMGHSDSYLATMPILSVTSPTESHGYATLQPPTPLSVNTPLGGITHAGMLSPMSPGAPPFLPPSLNGLEQTEPPPPPTMEAPDLGNDSLEVCMRACSGEMASGMLPTSPQKMTPPGPPLEPPKTPAPTMVAPEVADSKETPPVNPAPQEFPVSPSDMPSSPSAFTGSATKVAGRPVMLTDLISNTGQTSSPITPINSVAVTASTTALGTSGSPTLVPTPADLPLWPPQMTSIPVLPSGSPIGSYWQPNSWQDYALSQPLDWSSYSQAQAVDSSGLLYTPTARLPPPLPGVSPASLGGYSTLANPNAPAGGLDRDSPRSALLTLCGAWGALKAPRTDQLSKAQLLAYRGVVPRGSRPKHLKSMRTMYL